MPMKPPLRTIAEIYERYLLQPAVSIDSRKVAAGGMFFALRGTRADGNQYAASALDGGAGYAVVDDPNVVPARDDRYLLVDDVQTALQQLAAYHRSTFRMPVLAITGSNGKTTTKELIAAVMGRQYSVHATPGNYNNHLGLPLTILGMPRGTEFLLLEMGANHVGEIAGLCRIGQPTHGLVTNIGDAHLEGFGGRAGVIRGKGELYDHLAANRGIGFVNQDEAYLADMAAAVSRVIPYFDSDAPSVSVPGMEIRRDGLSPTVSVAFLSDGELISATTQLSGQHNLQNIKTAIAVGKYFKVPGRQIAAALREYAPENHRSQWLTHRGIRFYWDAYNANPSSVAAALESFATLSEPAASVVVLGEMRELGEASAAAHRRVALRAGQVARTVLLVGEGMRSTAEEFDRPHFTDSSVLKDWFWAQDWTDKQVFVKGSRGNRLERLLD
jgi:UDP-N-acetylmuramoyl-tripeptide--D-alanyl-D-alanine ligase